MTICKSNPATVTLVETKHWRLLWFRQVSFGLPGLIRNFYSGPNHLITAWNLWFEWRLAGFGAPVDDV